jgi:phosphohistidine phosphatase
MQLLLVRHAEAVDVGGDVTTDADRPLTPRGTDTARKLADALAARRFQLEAVVSSPFVRAKQTAEPLLALAPPGRQMVLCPDLEPMAQNPKAVAAVLAGLGVASAAVVGHLPDISVFAGWLIGGGGIGFDRGTAALIDTDSRVSLGAGAVRWVVSAEWYV